MRAEDRAHHPGLDAPLALDADLSLDGYPVLTEQFWRQSRSSLKLPRPAKAMQNSHPLP